MLHVDIKKYRHSKKQLSRAGTLINYMHKSHCTRNILEMVYHEKQSSKRMKLKQIFVHSVKYQSKNRLWHVHRTYLITLGHEQLTDSAQYAITRPTISTWCTQLSQKSFTIVFIKAKTHRGIRLKLSLK